MAYELFNIEMGIRKKFNFKKTIFELIIVQNQPLLRLIIHTKAKLFVECNGLGKVDCRKIVSDMICHFFITHLESFATTNDHPKTSR
jgi:hypothetical protein